VSAKPVRIFSGPDSVRAADAYRLAIQDRRDQWPYVHVYPPLNAIDVHVVGMLATQTQVGSGGAAAVVLTYQVNAGKRFYLQAVLLGCNVSPFVPGDGLFTIDRNSPVGVTDSQFMPEHGLVNVPVQLGRVEPATSSVIAEWPLKRAREFSPLDIIRVKATNVNLAEGAPAFWVCGLFGYEVPSLDVKASR